MVDINNSPYAEKYYRSPTDPCDENCTHPVYDTLATYEPAYIRRDEVVSSLRRWAREADAEGERFALLGSGVAATRKFAQSDAFADAADAFERGGE